MATDNLERKFLDDTYKYQRQVSKFLRDQALAIDEYVASRENRPQPQKQIAESKQVFLNTDEFPVQVPWRTNYAKTKSKNYSDWVSQVLSIYRLGEDFLSLAVNQHVKEIFSNTQHRIQIQDSVNLYIQTPTTKYSIEELRKRITTHLTYRYPVYFGKPETFQYDDAQLKKVLNYSTKDVTDRTIKHPLGVRYTLVGDAWTITGRLFSVAHCWGVNFETNQTEDYQKFMMANKRLDLTKYTDVMYRLVFSVVQGALDRNCNTIVFPMIGFGAFLTQLRKESPADVGHAVISYLTALLAAAKLCDPDRTTIRLAPGPEWAKNPGILAYIAGSTLPINFLIDVEQPDLFLEMPEDEHARPRRPGVLWGKVCLVNAWDSNSMIGNGGSGDNTVDGWLVAGWGPNSGANPERKRGEWRNCSYLHDRVFNPGLYQKDWQSLSLKWEAAIPEY
jgi:hypothetical protein